MALAKLPRLAVPPVHASGAGFAQAERQAAERHPATGSEWRRSQERGRCLWAAVGAATAGILQRRKSQDSQPRVRLCICTSGSALETEPLAAVPETAWPLLRRAEQADPQFGSGAIAEGLAGWRRALEAGQVWEDAAGAHWPQRSLRQQWAEVLVQLGLPRLTRRYPQLVDPLLYRLLEMAVQVAEATFGAASEQSNSKGESPQASESSRADGGEASPEGSGEQQDGATGEPSLGESADPEAQEEEELQQPSTREELVDQLMDDFREDWGQSVEALSEAEEAFGVGGVQSLASTFTSQGAPWRHSGGWEVTARLREVLKKMPALRDLVRSLGRRTALRGPRKRLPMEAEKLGGRAGVARSRLAPSEIAGLARTGSWEVMLPAEAILLVQGRTRPALRSLHHARRMEEALIGYNRASWLDTPTHELRSEEARPADGNGPIILCLDTSGSMCRMGGAPEIFAKAIVFECMRKAHSSSRRCCLFAFSAGEELQQFDLDLSPGGLDGLLEFLQYAFHGGTSLEEVLRASCERLDGDLWRNADVLLVTDGEVPQPTASVTASLRTAREERGARVYGIVVGDAAGSVMSSLCGDLYKVCTSSGRALSEDGPLNLSDWRLRCVQGRSRSALWASAPPSRGHGALVRHAFAGATAQASASRPRGDAGGWALFRRAAPSRRPRVHVQALREAALHGEQREETPEERALREETWRARREAKEAERQQSNIKNKKGWRWVGGKWVTKEESREQESKIDIAYREACLREARLEDELRRRAGQAPELEGLEEDPVAAAWAEQYLSSFSSGLLNLLLDGSRQARSLGQVQFGTNAAFLGLLSSPGCAPLCRRGLPSFVGGGENHLNDPLEVARSAVEFLVQHETLADAAPRRAGQSQHLPLTKSLRGLLEQVEAERARLGHELASPSHLLLALTSGSFAVGALDTLRALGADPKQLRLRALESLGDFLAKAQSKAESELLRRRRGSRTARSCGQSMPGLPEAFNQLTKGLMERSVEAKLLLLAALSGEHLFLLGSPGTAKSLLSRRLSGICAGSFFERLLTRFSVPEEIFGPLSLQALERDELCRKTDGFLPDCDVAFIDEIFKANSSILNTLLMILNDRCFDNGAVRTQVPLWCAVAASNELPDTDELDALYDRFLLRRCVRRISADGVQRFLRLALDADDSGLPQASAPADGAHGSPKLLSAQASEELRARAHEVDFPDHLLQMVSELREYLATEAEPPYVVSDRRLFKAVRLVRVAAAAAGATSVVEADLLILRHVFWDRNPEQGDQVAQWLLNRFVEDSFGHKAWAFLLDGLRKRLRADPQAHSLEAARRDLKNLRKAASKALDVATRVARNAPREVDKGYNGGISRFFWLSEEERRQADEVAGQAEQGVAAIGEILVEAEVLSAVVAVEDESRRKELVAQVLGHGKAGADEEPKEIVRDEWGDPI